jgi:hypothetical protein
MGKKFKSTFFGGDSRSAAEYAFFEVLIPSAKDILVDVVTSGFERLVHGDRAPRRRSAPMGQLGRVDYGGISRGSSPMRNYQAPRTLSRQARARHDFGEIVLSTRAEAEEVLDRLYDLVSQYEEATLADLYSLTGLESSHVDVQWGWTKLQGSHVGRLRGGGYILNLPEPEALK